MRLFERRHGLKAGPELEDSAVRGLAETHARVCLALRSFFHPAAGRELLWNIRATPELRPLLAEIEEPGRRALVERTLDRYDERVRGSGYVPRLHTATSTSTTFSSTSVAA